jgi:phosphoribosylformimino-5-aminoimidazole carboxamide ribotide isomerase
MLIFPAIDLMGGQAVHFRKDAEGQVGLVEEDPVAVARRWQSLGARWLHVVDLDGAREGQPTQTEIVAAIAGATELAVQLAGGLRGEDDVAAALEHGIARVILGTAVARQDDLLAACLARWDERVAVSVDARGDAMTVAGWLGSQTETPTDFAWRMVRMGVRTLVMAAMEQDGSVAAGPSQRLLKLRTALPQVALLAAGGITTVEDIRALASAAIDGAILGRALYDGTLELQDALRVAAEATPTPLALDSETGPGMVTDSSASAGDQPPAVHESTADEPTSPAPADDSAG